MTDLEYLNQLREKYEGTICSYCHQGVLHVSMTMHATPKAGDVPVYSVECTDCRNGFLRKNGM